MRVDDKTLDAICDSLDHQGHMAGVEAIRQLRGLLHNLEVAANTVDYCYVNRPSNFAAALRDLRDAATAARRTDRESGVTP